MPHPPGPADGPDRGGRGGDAGAGRGRARLDVPPEESERGTPHGPQQRIRETVDARLVPEDPPRLEGRADDEREVYEGEGRHAPDRGAGRAPPRDDEGGGRDPVPRERHRREGPRHPRRPAPAARRGRRDRGGRAGPGEGEDRDRKWPPPPPPPPPRPR